MTKEPENMTVDQGDLRRLSHVVRMGFTAVLVLVIVLSSVSLYRLNQFNANMEIIVDVHNKKAALAFGMREAIRQRAISIYSMFANDNYFERDAELLRFYEYAGDYRRKREELVTLGMDKLERNIHERLIIVANSAQPANQMTAELLMQGASDKEINISMKIGLAEQKLLLDLLDELIDLQNEYTATAVESNKSEFQYIWILLLSLSIVVFTIGVVIARVVTRNVRLKSLELAARNEELSIAYHQAEEATRSKSRFLANMSHEIRTPMTGVLGMLDLLRDTELVAEQKHFVDTAYNSAEALLKLINNILNLSKIEAGKVELEEIRFDFRHLIEEVVGLYAKDVQSKGVEISAYIANDIPEYVLGDPTRLRQILNNLVSNAVKFTHKGEIFVGVESMGLPGSTLENMYRFEITDTGIGIPLPAQKKIFGLFTQADESTTRKFGGTGLGLAISEQMTKLCGGEIGVDSEEGKGSTFWFTTTLKTAGKRSSWREAHVFNQLSVYVYTQSNGMNKVITNFLEYWGCDVTTNLDGNKSPQSSVDIAILDIDELLKQGITDVYALRKKIVDAKQMIGLFKLSEPEAMSKTQYFHLNSSISRPVRRNPLFEILSKFQENTKDLVFSARRDKTTDQLSLKKCNVLLVDDNIVNQQVVVAILQKRGFSVSLANNGVEALDMVRHNDFDLILMDCQMPVMDGFDATREIRSNEKRSGKEPTPIIALTANAQDSDRQACLSAGMNDFLIKPVGVQDLTKIFDQYVFNKTTSAPVKSNQEKPIIAQRNIDQHIDFSVLDGMKSILTEAQFDEIKHSFKENVRLRFSELVIAIENKNLEAIELSAHSLKGSCANLGAAKLSKMNGFIVESIRQGEIPANINDLIRDIKDEIYFVEAFFAEQKISV